MATVLISIAALGLSTFIGLVFALAQRSRFLPLRYFSKISISELTLNAREVNSNTFSTLESYLPLAVGYLLLTLPISLWTRRLEKRHRYET